MAKFRYTRSVIQISTNPRSKRFGVQETCTDLWQKWTLDYSERANLLPRAVKFEYFAKVTEKSKILGNLLDKEV